MRVRGVRGVAREEDGIWGTWCLMASKMRECKRENNNNK